MYKNIILLVLLLTSCAKQPITPIIDPPIVIQQPDQSIEQLLLDAHNHIRISHHKAVLAINTKLMVAAQKHAEWMTTHRFSHRGASFSQPWDRAEKEGYEYMRIGENIACGQESITEVMQAWMTSSGHKANILGDFNEVGFGYVESGKYWVALFGKKINIE